MEPGSTRVWKDGRLQHADRNDAALASLCQAVEQAMREHPNAGVRAVIMMVDPPSPVRLEPAVVPPVQVYIDVFESGYSQDSGYGYGV
ncbi:MAG TPA: hypothetical protein VF491_10225 [Vicinamibacterales bacterium]